MKNLLTELQNARTTRDIEKILATEFIKRGYKKTYAAASHFQLKIEKELPGVNRWVLNMNRDTAREIEDVVADELKIAGS